MGIQAAWRHIPGFVEYWPTSPKASGEVVQLADGTAGVVRDSITQDEIDEGISTSVYTESYFDFIVDTSLLFDTGEAVFWDITGLTAIKAADVETGDFRIGIAQGAKVDGEILMRVNLNGRRQDVPFQLPVFATNPVDAVGGYTFYNSTDGLTYTYDGVAASWKALYA